MPQSLEAQLRLLLADPDLPSSEPKQRELLSPLIQPCPAAAPQHSSAEPEIYKCEVGGWVLQEMLDLGSDRATPVPRRPVLLWRKRDLRWIVFPGTTKKKLDSFTVKVSEWYFFDERNSRNFRKMGFFRPSHETIELMCFEPIGKLDNESGIKYRIWARAGAIRK